MEGRSILITGASGFTGRHFIEAANRQGYRCIAVAQERGSEVGDADENLVADLLDCEALDSVIKQTKPDFIVHLAAIAFPAHDDISELYQVNQLGTLNLLEAARKNSNGIERVLIASSANVYGNTLDLPITEATAAAPVNHYGTSKLAMEYVAQLYTDVPMIITRPFNYTGCGQSPNFLIPKIVSAYKANQRVIELGNLDVSRDFSDVRDLVRAYLLLLEVGDTGIAYNICSGVPTSLLAIIEILNSIAGYELRVSVNPEFVRSDEIKTLYGSPALLESTIGSYREYTLTDTLKWMLGF